PVDTERGACRGRARPEAVGGRGVCGRRNPRGIPLLPIYDFIVGVIELDVAREMPPLGADIRDFHHGTLTKLLLDRKAVIVFGRGGPGWPDRLPPGCSENWKRCA